MRNNISQSKKGQRKEAKKKVAEARNIIVFSLPEGFLSNCGTGVRFSLPTSNIPEISLKHVQLAR